MNGWKTKMLAVLASLALLCTLAVPASAATAATMQLSKTQGTVSVTNASGRTLSLMDNMRLYTGYTVETRASSYAWISLDSSKLVKLDAASRAEVRKSGSKLEILLESGNILFNVSQPLTANETMNVRTSTAIVGIRGTCGWVNVTNENTVQVYILEGTVQCTVTNPATGEARTVNVNSGEVVELTVHSELTGDTCGANVTAFKEDDVQGFVLADVLEDDALCGKILEYSGLNFTTGDWDAQSRLAADEAETNRLLEQAEREQSGQAANASTDPLWNTSTAPDFEPGLEPEPEPGSPPGSAPGPAPNRPVPEPAPVPTLVPTPGKPAPAPGRPTPSPTPAPSAEPGTEPSTAPSPSPSAGPSAEPGTDPSANPGINPSANPGIDPSANPSIDPSANPSIDPSANPSIDPSANPGIDPSANPSIDPSANPSIDPSANPGIDPSAAPSTASEAAGFALPRANEGPGDAEITGGPGQAEPGAENLDSCSTPLTAPGPDAILPGPAENGDSKLEDETP